MRRILERYLPTAGDADPLDEVSEEAFFRVLGKWKRPGLPLSLRAELPAALTATEIASLWAPDAETRAMIEQAITAAVRADALKASGWEDYIFEKRDPKITRKMLPPKEPKKPDRPPSPSEQTRPKPADKRRRFLPPAPKRPPLPGTVVTVESRDGWKHVPLIHRDAFARWLKNEGERVPEGLARWITTSAGGKQSVFDARAEALRAVVEELKAKGRDLHEDAPTKPRLFALCADWRRETYADARGFIGRNGKPNFTTWLREFWRKGGLEIFDQEK